MLTMLITLARGLRAPSRAERELAYLNSAVDRYDLEYRQRQIDRGQFRETLTPHLR